MDITGSLDYTIQVWLMMCARLNNGYCVEEVFRDDTAADDAEA